MSVAVQWSVGMRLELFRYQWESLQTYILMVLNRNSFASKGSNLRQD